MVSLFFWGKILQNLIQSQSVKKKTVKEKPLPQWYSEQQEVSSNDEDKETLLRSIRNKEGGF